MRWSLDPVWTAPPLRVYEIRHLPTVERQLDDPLGLDYGAHARIPGFNQGSIGFHVDSLVDLPDFQRDFNQRVALDLELDPGLHVSCEAFLTDFQPVWPKRQVRQDPAAISAADCGANQAGTQLSGFDFRARHARTARVLNRAVHLRRTLRPAGCTRHNEQAQYNEYPNVPHEASLRSPFQQKC
jgi:hypothetical protein